jgi:hypothetical protein
LDGQFLLSVFREKRYIKTNYNFYKKKDMMRKLIIILLYFLLVNNIKSQLPCGTDHFSDLLSYQVTEVVCPQIGIDHITSISIPVIVHALYDENFANVDYQTIVDMINNTNNEIATVQIEGYTVDISLYLAETGTCTPGYERIYIENPFISASSKLEDELEDERIKSACIWDIENFLNIWIVESIDRSDGVLAGYSTFPDMIHPYDGIVLDDTYLSVLTHEFGHYCGLYHLWETRFNDPIECQEHNDCRNGDFVDDTFEVKSSFFHNPPTQSCTYWTYGFWAPWNYLENNGLTVLNPQCFVVENGSGEEWWQYQYDNFMSYSDECSDKFTEGQYIRMVNELNDHRENLILNPEPIQIVDLSSNTTHNISEMLAELGLNNLTELCSSMEKYSILLGGNLVFDSGFNNPVCFGNGTTFKMLEGAKITISNNTSVFFNDVKIFGCESYWDEIFIEHGSSLQFNEVFLSKGTNGIITDSSDPYSDESFVSIIDCQFEDFLKDAINIQTKGDVTLRSNTIENVGNCGIHLEGEIDPIAIENNSIDNAYIGFRAKDLKGFPNLHSFTINNCNTGISLLKSQGDINYSEINNCDYGISLTKSYFSIVQNNIIGYNKIGVKVWDNYGLKITQNTIGRPENYGHSGIRMFWGDDVEIYDNPSILASRNGIWGNFVATNVHDNLNITVSGNGNDYGGGISITYPSEQLHLVWTISQS